jgi:hypothetical protein
VAVIVVWAMRALVVLGTLGKLYRIYLGARDIWRQLMAWDEEGRINQARLERAALERRRRERDPWLYRARTHERRAVVLRAQLDLLRRMAAQRTRWPPGSSRRVRVVRGRRGQETGDTSPRPATLARPASDDGERPGAA